MLLLIDNYDSFSYNLYQMFGALNPDIKVIRNDEKTVEEVALMQPDHIVLSPGPGYPADAGICEDVVRSLGVRFPVLGICLGHQAVCEVFGAAIRPADHLMHGKQSRITLEPDCPLFEGLGNEIDAARYHSLVAVPETLPDVLKITAMGPAGEVMAVQHREYPVYGLQFHPESILTPEGNTILKNFLAIRRR